MRLKAILISIAVLIVIVLAIAIPVSVSKSNQRKQELEREANTEYTITFNFQGGSGGTANVKVKYNQAMPSATAPSMAGHIFQGYYSAITGGVQYYTSSMSSAKKMDKKEDMTLYARWTANTYKVTLDPKGGSGGTTSVTATYGEPMPSATAPTKSYYNFGGYSDSSGRQYYTASMASARNWDKTSAMTLEAQWTAKAISVSATPSSLTGIDGSSSTTISATGGSGSYTYAIVSTSHSGVSVALSGNKLTLTKNDNDKSGAVSVRATDTVTGATASCNVSYSTTGGCVATGTLITLENGSMMPVEQLTGEEMLLVWNLFTGTFDVAPILFIDSDAETEYEIIHLYFSDGTDVKVIYEHGFWDFNLNKYIFLRNDAAQYIGHWYNKQIIDESGNFAWTKVQLINVVIEYEYTMSWSPVTFGHLCYYVNGMLSIPGETEGLINIFEVDSEIMQYDEAAFEADIAKYGLFTYEDFADILPELMFEAFGGAYLKISMGKGLIDWETIYALVERYSEYLLG